jgi:hypothetical protein
MPNDLRTINISDVWTNFAAYPDQATTSRAMRVVRKALRVCSASPLSCYGIWSEPDQAYFLCIVGSHTQPPCDIRMALKRAFIETGAQERYPQPSVIEDLLAYHFRGEREVVPGSLQMFSAKGHN